MFTNQWDKEIEKMRICIINPFARSPSESTTSTRHHSLASYLNRMGHQTLIVSGNLDQRAGKIIGSLVDGQKYAKENHEGIEYVRINTPVRSRRMLGRLSNSLDFWRGLNAVKRELFEWRPDLIIGSSPHLPGAFKASLLAKKLGIPFVSEIRDIWPLTAIEVGGFSKYHPFVMVLAYLEKRLYLNSAGIIHLLSNAHEHVKHVLRRPVNYIWLPHGIDTDLANKRIYNQINSSCSERIKVIYAGSFGPSNSVSTLLNAIKIIKAKDMEEYFEFIFIGDGSEKEQLKLMTRDLGLANVFFRDSVPKCDIYSAIQDADIYWVNMHDSPLYRYGSSLNKLYDYMYLGKPVVLAANLPYDPVTESECGFVVGPNNAEKIAESVIKLRQLGKKHRLEMGSKGARWVLEHSTFDALTKKLVSFLSDIVSQEAR